MGGTALEGSLVQLRRGTSRVQHWEGADHPGPDPT